MSPSPLAWLGLAALPLFASAQDDGSPSVTITASKDAVVRKVDKTVVDVSTMARAQNGTAQDVLQSTPELSVAADGTISVRGNANVTVLVDGKPSAMLAGDERAVALQTMSGADIASVEVITNPSAVYHANGGAIVNLVLKRQRQPGAHAVARRCGSAYTRQEKGSVLKAVLARSSTRSLIDKSYSDVSLEPLRASSDSRGATRAARRLDQATLDWTRASILHSGLP